MKKKFTKSFYLVSVVIFFLGSILRANAQYTVKALGTNVWATATFKDASGNIYVIEDPTHVQNGNVQILEYPNGSNTPVTLYSGTGFVDFNNGSIEDYTYGLVVASNGDIYVNTYNSYGNSVYGNIVKLTKSGSTYTPSVFIAGNAIVGGFESIAIDASDNLYTVQVDMNGNGGLGSYEVAEYLKGSTSSIKIYDQLGISYFASADLYSTPTGLALDASGNIYVADNFDKQTPSHYGGVVVKLTKSGSTYTPSNFSTNKFVRALSVDAAGNVYATEGNSANSAYLLVEYPNGAPGSPTVIYSALGNNGLFYPTGLAAVSSTNIFVVDGDATSGIIGTGNFLQIFGPATTQASNVTFSSITGTSATASWTDGNGSNRAVFIAAATSGSPLPVNSTTYSAASGAYTTGTQIGSSGWYCVYNGNGTSAPISGLSAATNYRVMVVEYNGPAGAENYLITTATGNPANFTTPTTINSINRVASSLNNATSVQYTATFGASVTGVTASNFSLTTTGVSGASITSVTGSGTTYTVTVNTGTGDGTIALNLANATGITPGVSTTLPFAGQVYTIDKTPPTVTISAPSVATTTTGPVTYTVTYADANFNSSTLANANITLNTTGTATGTVSVSGTGTTRTVTISSITGTGTLGITIAAGTATDLAGNSAPAAGPSGTFTVGASSSVATLANFSLSSGTLTPAFASGTTSYTASVSNATSNITVTPTTTDATATVKVNGTTVTSGSASGAIALAVGPNTITTVVTAQDGTTTGTYTVTVTRAASTVATLSNLAISSGTLTPAFASGTTSYTASVSNATSNITVTPTTTDATATVKVNGTTVTSGSASGAIALAVG
ncbi:MAG: hypothetical protein JWP44_3012, partial [Mucilaginibacter sp.]|nr:hypothetical protein [Mucilaginibacter sp.]